MTFRDIDAGVLLTESPDGITALKDDSCVAEGNGCPVADRYLEVCAELSCEGLVIAGCVVCCEL